MLRADQHHQLVLAERQGLQPLLARGEGEHAEVERAAEHLARDLPRVHAPHLDLRVRVLAPEPLDDGQQDVHGALVGADEHASAPQVLELADGARRLVLEPRQPLRVVEQDLARLGELAALGGTVEQPLVQLFLEPLDRLAHRRLRAVQPRGGAREAALGRDGDEYLQLAEVHSRYYNPELSKRNIYNFDFRPAAARK